MTGPSNIPPAAAGAAVLLGLLILGGAVGRRALIVLGFASTDSAHDLRPSERAAVGAALGLGALQIVPFALFSVGLGSSLGFRVALAALAIVLWRDVIASARRLATIVGQVVRLRGAHRLGTVVFCALSAALFLRAVCPIVDGDVLAYHLTAVERWLDAGRFVYIPTITYAQWPMGTEALVAMALGFWPEAPAGMVQFAFGIVSVGITYVMGRRIGGASAGPAHGLAACAALLAFSRYWGQFVGMWVEVAGAALMTAAALCAVVLLPAAARAPDPRSASARAAGLIGVLAGLTATTKLSCLLCVPVMAMVVLLYGDARAPLSIVDRRRAALVVIVVGVAVAAPWFVRCWVHTGSPVWPALIGVLGGRDWSAASAARFFGYHRHWSVLPGFPRSGAGLAASYAVTLLACAGLAAVVVRRTRASTSSATASTGSATVTMGSAVVQAPARTAVLVLVALAITGYVNSRFAIPAFPCAAVALARGPACLVARMDRGTLSRWASWSLCALGVVLAMICFRRELVGAPTGPAGGRPSGRGIGLAARVALGMAPRRDWLVAQVPGYAVMEYAAYALRQAQRPLRQAQRPLRQAQRPFAQARQPGAGGARLLVVTTDDYTAYLPPGTCTGNAYLQGIIQYGSVTQLTYDLRTAGITHVLYNPDYGDDCRRRAACALRMEAERPIIEAVLRERGTLVFASEGSRLVALDLGAGASTGSATGASTGSATGGARGHDRHGRLGRGQASPRSDGTE
jgi:hypothetical protein